ncbi:MAG: hypothetical protein CVV49_07145 [Spirochaetae bacterium HGW-Spirochaetae-5]|nr:MAG: hypothetical protein CVV49_07145 [Spirochaetae bacterium HGW-Spirochaetae-5]
MIFFPDYNNTEIQSLNFGEMKVYQMFHQLYGYDDWFCLHSVTLPRHITQSEGEADFIIIGPVGLFLFEVKGATSIKIRDDGKWQFFNGNKSYIKKNPYHQARENLNTIVHEFERYCRHNNIRPLKPISDFAVIFTSLTERPQGLENDWKQKTILYQDLENINVFKSRIDNLINTTKESVTNFYQLPFYKCTTDYISILKEFIRAKFYIPPGVLQSIEYAEYDMKRLTDQQADILIKLSVNRRILISGAAGTGKTILAKKIAIEKSFSVKKVLFVCFSVLISTKIQSDLETFHETIDVLTLNELIRQLSGMNCNIDDIDELETAIELIIENTGHDKYDYVIVDEGQDILTNKLFSILNAVLNDGIENGCWAIFYDPFFQSDIFRRYDPLFVESLIKKSGATQYPLVENLRNCRQIIKDTKFVTGYPLNCHDDMKHDGRVVIIPWIEPQEQIKLIKENLEMFSKQDIPVTGDMIDIVSLKGEDQAVWKELVGSNIFDYHLERLTKINVTKRDNIVGLSSIYRYKGLENSIVIITDFDTEVSDKIRSLVYTAMTRARVNLIILIKSSAQKNLVNRKSKF